MAGPIRESTSTGATKRYLKNFSRGLHTELRDYGVYVTAVCPGAVGYRPLAI